MDVSNFIKPRWRLNHARTVKVTKPKLFVHDGKIEDDIETKKVVVLLDKVVRQVATFVQKMPFNEDEVSVAARIYHVDEPNHTIFQVIMTVGTDLYFSDQAANDVERRTSFMEDV